MIPKRAYKRFEGRYKYLTKNCEMCPFFREFENFSDRADLICGVGVQFKYLVEREAGARKCEYFSFEVVGLNKTMTYLNKLKSLGKVGRSKLLRHRDLKEKHSPHNQLSLPLIWKKK